MSDAKRRKIALRPLDFGSVKRERIDDDDEVAMEQQMTADEIAEQKSYERQNQLDALDRMRERAAKPFIYRGGGTNPVLGMYTRRILGADGKSRLQYRRKSDMSTWHYVQRGSRESQKAAAERLKAKFGVSKVSKTFVQLAKKKKTGDQYVRALESVWKPGRRDAITETDAINAQIIVQKRRAEAFRNRGGGGSEFFRSPEYRQYYLRTHGKVYTGPKIKKHYIKSEPIY